MKCTDITNLNLQLRRIAVKELEKAVGSLPNKEYMWFESLPVVNSIDDAIHQIQILRVRYDEALRIEGRDIETDQFLEVDSEKLSAQDIFFIVETITTNEKNDADVSTDGLQRRLDLLCEFMKTV